MKKRPQLRWIFIGMGLLLVTCCGLTFIIGALAPDDRGGEEAIAVDEEIEVTVDSPTPTMRVTNTVLAPTTEATDTPLPPTATVAPESTATPTVTSTPTATLEPIVALEVLLIQEIGRSNRGADPRIELLDQNGVVEVMWAINDNLTASWVRTGIMIDIANMLEVFAGDAYPYNTVVFRGTFPLVDAFGNSSEETVVVATYTRETIQRINFSNFLHSNVYAIADDLFLHAVMRD